MRDILAAEHIDSLPTEFAAFTPEPVAEIDQ
jgi:hypothetical protein